MRSRELGEECVGEEKARGGGGRGVCFFFKQKTAYEI